VTEMRVWLGKPGYFKSECLRLIELLRSLVDSNSSIALENGDKAGFQWILDPVLTMHPSEGPGKGVSLFTSGTTGTPKPIFRNWMDALDKRKGSGSIKDKWLLTFSPTRWAGLSVIAHCLKHDSEVVVPDGLTSEDISNSLEQCTHIALTPSFFRKLQISRSAIHSKKIRQVTFGGEPCSQSTIDSAQMVWPCARISHIYAAAEFGDLVCASDGKEGFPNLPGQVGQDGELIINGCRTGDIWQQVNHRWYFRGRANEVVNVGGAKVHLYEVEQVLARIHGILECRVFAATSPLVGQLLCAEYVGIISERDLTLLLRGLLPKYAVPKLNKVESIQLTEAGKVRRV